MPPAYQLRKIYESLAHLGKKDSDLIPGRHVYPMKISDQGVMLYAGHPP
jgi:hypothetical protein